MVGSLAEMPPPRGAGSLVAGTAAAGLGGATGVARPPQLVNASKTIVIRSQNCFPVLISIHLFIIVCDAAILALLCKKHNGRGPAPAIPQAC
jgi:hypothetical protein